MIHVLFDENMPRELRRDFPSFEIRTAQEEGWSGLNNGDLLRAAQAKFAVLVTGDKRLEFQQNIAAFSIAVVVVPSTRLVHLRPLVERMKLVIEQAQPAPLRWWSRVNLAFRAQGRNLGEERVNPRPDSSLALGMTS